MARFDELVGQLQNPGEDGLPPTIYDDLLAEYNTVMEGSAQVISKKDEAIQSLNSEVSRLKSNNYDLLTQVSNGSDPIDGISDGEDDGITIDGLFKKVNR